MSPIKNNKKFVWLFTAVSTCGLYACGGSTPVSSMTDEVAVVGPMQTSGTIVLEERNGKTIFDGWFVQSLVSDTTPAVSAANPGDDYCVVDSVNIDNVLSSSIDQNSNDWSELESIDGTVSIKSRAGDFESLVKQRAGDTTVYASSERWQSDALPDDAVLSFDANSIFGHMDGVDVPPLMPLVWTAPETGFMASAAATLSWEGSLNDEVRINLKLSSIDFSSSENPTVTSIDCNLIDDGEFNLSAELQQQLPDDHTGIVVYAVREHVQQIQSDDSMLTVVQLSYPAAN